ncbi:MAG: cob(I)yrinic acid a,c-diamide adenosyltransferase [Bacteroidales bacterium]|nr:cob(I)yrinic acid a,c-diamide adenosyltransferase [Bacteroidales bacterium]
MSRESKIYTRTGDRGETSLSGGTRVSKCHERVEAYGNLDELNSFIGLIRDQDIDDHDREILQIIQENLFIAEAWIASDPEKKTTDLPPLGEETVVLLEEEIDTMNDKLPHLQHFILPGGHPIVSYCHIARTVCRRAERSLVRLKKSSFVADIIICFMNRLSDYLFVLARKTGQDHGADETSWFPQKKQ